MKPSTPHVRCDAARPQQVDTPTGTTTVTTVKKPARLSAALLAALLTASACADTTTGADLQPAVTYPNSPETLPTGLVDGDATITHESGVSYPVEVRRSLVETPVLWDGLWKLEAADGETITLEIGAHQGRTTKLTTGDVLACWDRETETVTAESVRCTQAIMMRLALTGGYPAAETALKGALDTIGRNSSMWGWYCHLGGTVAAAGAVLAGADPRQLMNEHKSICDFSVSHGAGVAAVTMAPDRAGQVLNEICTPDETTTILPYSYGSQCWHGGGMGLARIHRFEPAKGLAVCLQAPDQGWAGNCIEGMFVGFRDYEKRLDDEWDAARPTLERCNETTGAPLANRYFMIACYRDAAILIYQDLNRSGQVGSGDVGPSLDKAAATMEAACKRTPSTLADEACWIATANVISELLGTDIGNRDQITQWWPICERAPGNGLSCYQRLIIGIVETGQRRDGIPLDELLALTPGDVRGELRPIMLEWLATLEDRSI
jgi:hypothetical protein